MRTFRRLRLPVAAFAAAAFACAQAIPATSSSFTATTGNSGNTASAAADWLGPTVSGVLISKSQGGVSGRIRQGGTFYVYGNATDSGNPATGVASLTADVSTIATVASAAMTSGSYTVGGTSYDYRSAALTAKATLATGTYSYSVKGTDSGGNVGTATTGSVTVDSTAFGGSGFGWDDKGIAGKIEAGDVFSWVYIKTVEPASLSSGWDGSAKSVTVKVADASPDTITVFDGVTQVPVGSAYLNGAYVAAGKTLSFTGSTMSASGGRVTITLGTIDVAANAKTVTNASALLTWAPSASAYDTAGNPAATTTVSGFGGSSYSATNKTGGVAGRPESGDTVTFTYNRAPDPNSVLSGWDGTATPVKLRVYDKAAAQTASDAVGVFDSAGTLLELGGVVTGGNYVTSGVAEFASTMTLVGTSVKVTLGTTAATVLTDTGSRGFSWSPYAGVTDLFGLNSSTAAVGASAVQF